MVHNTVLHSLHSFFDSHYINNQTEMTSVATLQQIQQRISQAELDFNRKPNSVKLIGASKTQSSETIETFYQAGLSAVGENYLQEALNKQSQLTQHNIEWHFIGGIQSNKTKDIANNFDWVHTVDRLKIAQRINNQRDTQLQSINCLIQININDETSKNGVSLSQAGELAAEINELENINLRGFMAIPETTKDTDQQRRNFALVRQALEQVNQQYGLKLDSLSMGMSQDLEAAIAEGSTMVRIGTDLFGKRPPAKPIQS